MKVGFIGTGSMGSILIESFIQSGALEPKEIMASNRTWSKAEQLAVKYPGLEVARSNIVVVHECQIIFLCVKPKEFKKVIDDIKNYTIPSQIIVSITSPVLIRHLEQELDCKIAKMIPSITNFVLGGATLCIYGERLTQADRDLLDNLLGCIGAPVHISERYARITSDLSSCGPAFLAFFIQKFVDAAVQETGIPHETAVKLAAEMVLGTGKLLTAGGFSPENLQKRVSVPGGITAEGLRIMAEELDGLFNRLIRTTHAKYEKDLEEIEAMFSSVKKD